ncbi:MAG: hypothetical protein KJ880_04350 [Candidatus Omnitrophica bacterium]|nr:hypothetical protein [Candidatus Omnitrophota bacterium]
MKKLIFAILIAACMFSMNEMFAAVPASPSEVAVRGNHLIVKKRLSDNSLADPDNFYIIKGVTWSPASRAPVQGPNPLNTSENIPYGFFHNWSGRVPQGQDILQYWKESQHGDYLSDIALMKNMNVNTVRLYSDFAGNEGVLESVLDEFYRNGIMVILCAGNSREDIDDLRFDVFSNTGAVYNHYLPTGWMGDAGDLAYQEETRRDSESSIKITYSATSSANNWAGIFWQYPDNNWGAYDGYDLRPYNKLVFKAKGASGGEIINKVFIGISGTDTAHAEVGPLVLTSQWQEFSINLSTKDLSNIRGGFGFTVEKANGARTFYLDDIYYAYDPALGVPGGEVKYKKIVRQYKDHPTVLMWCLGNEWNLASVNNFHGFASTLDAANGVERAAQGIKALDSMHPVSSSLGNNFDYLAQILTAAPNVDIWGLNIYQREASGYDPYFTIWRTTTSKPFYFSEMGTDSFFTTSYSEIPGTGKAASCQGVIDEVRQRDHVAGIWNHIEPNLNIFGTDNLCVGGLVHEFNDEIWKVGNFNAGMGDLVDYDGPDNILGNADDDTSYDEYNQEGLVLWNGHPDGVANEEYFGVVDADRNPKQIFGALTEFYNTLDSKVAENTFQSPFFSTGWHLVSVPASLSTTDPRVVFVDINPVGSGFFWQFDAAVQRLNTASSIEMARGYWLYVHKAGSIGVVGQPNNQERTINLRAGWNLIGNPFNYTLPLNNMSFVYGGKTRNFDNANYAGWIYPCAWAWSTQDGVYETVDALNPWQGAWIYCRVDNMALTYVPYGGRAIKQKVLSRNTSLPALTPKIASRRISGSYLIIKGENFGPYFDKGSTYVELDTVSGKKRSYHPSIRSWNNSTIYCRISDLRKGEYALRVVNKDGESNIVNVIISNRR